MFALASELFPICRSITGDGVRQTLARLAQVVPLEVHEIPTGTPVLDWTIPNEWNVRDAWIATTSGRRVVDFRSSNLHVLNYSAPVRARVTRAELDAHLFSLPDHPDWIPYRTSYYRETWGFCVSERQRAALTDPEYDVAIDSTLAPGSLTYAECLISGRQTDEVLLSAHVCHPSLANDNLSGLVVLAAAAQRLIAAERRFSYRLLFAPGTIGAIAWLARNRQTVDRVHAGLVVSCLGDAGGFTYKRSRRGHAAIDRVFEAVARETPGRCALRDFSPDGYDERQYGSPGFNLPVGRLTRTPNGEYPEYHSSADDLSLLTPRALEDSAACITEALDMLEGNGTFLNLAPYGEPQLGRRGLYGALGGTTTTPDLQRAVMWVLNLSDGRHDLLEIAERARLPFATVRRAADALLQQDLLSPAPSASGSMPRGQPGDTDSEAESPNAGPFQAS
jgi:aminopeptidase-like protein